jgi:hypothetical protein
MPQSELNRRIAAEQNWMLQQHQQQQARWPVPVMTPQGMMMQHPQHPLYPQRMQIQPAGPPQPMHTEGRVGIKRPLDEASEGNKKAKMLRKAPSESCD